MSEEVKIEISVDKDTYKRFKDYKNEYNGDLSDDQVITGILELFFDTKITGITKKDLSWVKYIYAINMFMYDMIKEYKSVHPSEDLSLSLITFYMHPIMKLIDSLQESASEYILAEDESKYIDAINIFSEYFKRMKPDVCNIKKMSKTLNVLLEGIEE